MDINPTMVLDFKVATLTYWSASALVLKYTSTLLNMPGSVNT